MEKILISGASGLIGKTLTELLIKNNFEVIHLLRKKTGLEKQHVILWQDIEKNTLDVKKIKIDHIIHLAGENIGAKRWTKKQKHKIRSSRVGTSKLLVEFFKDANVKTVVSASGISYYGLKSNELSYDEFSLPGEDFLAQVSCDWEKEIDAFSAFGTRVVKLRTAVVLSPDGGAIQDIAKTVKRGFGAALGSGKQYFPWIHIDDLCELYKLAICNKEMNGVYNALAPEIITNKQLMNEIATVLNKKIRLPNVPGFLLYILFGEVAALLLNGNKIISTRLPETGFAFIFPEINKALSAVIKHEMKN